MTMGCAGAIKQGATFEDFMVRGVAALVSQMDSPLAGLPPMDDSPLARELTEARAYMLTLESMTDEQAQAESDAEYAAQRLNREAIQRDREKLRLRYEATLAQLLKWNPQVEAFDSIKSRLVDDIAQSIKQDCCQCSEPPLMHMTALEWRIEKTFRQKLLIKQLEHRNNVYTALQALSTSLGIEPSAPT